MDLLRGNTVLDRYAFWDSMGYGWSGYSNLPAGTYTIRFQVTWTPYDVRDYTVSVYSEDKFPIYDSNGRTSVDDPTPDLKAALAKASNNLG